MQDMIKDLLLNLLFVLLPLFLYQMFWLERYASSTGHSWFIIGLLNSISGLLCMIFPVHAVPGYFYDLRLIPIISSYLYGGIPAGAFTSIVITLYRGYLGGGGMYSSFAVTLLISLICIPVAIKFPSFSSRKKIITSVSIILLGAAAVIIFSSILNKNLLQIEDFKYLVLEYLAINTLSMFILAFMTNTIINNLAIREMVEQSKKMKIVSELAASVSHEVRNPLTVTRGFVQLLREDHLSPEKRNGFIELALEELKRAETIISDYLSFAKPQLEAIEDLEVHQEVKYVSDVLSPYASMQKVEIQLNVPSTCLIRGERDKFRQCLMNLAKNAVESMPNGGVLSLGVSRLDKWVEVRISDTGTGMTREQMSRLGSPYYSTKDKGTGLGTMVVYSIIRAMGGKIEVESEVGKGTTFSLSLPAVQ